MRFSAPLLKATVLMVLAIISAAPRAAQAQGEALMPDRHEASAQAAMSAGAFATWSMAARSDTQQTQVHLSGGYDVARGGAQFESVLESRIIGRLSLRAGGSYLEPTGKIRPLFGAKLDALRQEVHGIDMALASGYEPYGFNTVPAVATQLALGRSFGGMRLLANVGYGFGLEEGEHYGDVRLAALYGIGKRFRVGLDSRARVDLERDTQEPEGEPDWEVVAGPLATVTAGPFAASGGFGVSAIRRRFETSTTTGPLAYLSLSAVF